PSDTVNEARLGTCSLSDNNTSKTFNCNEWLPERSVTRQRSTFRGREGGCLPSTSQGDDMRVHRIVWVGVLWATGSLPAAAQTIQGSSSGTIVDSQGASLPRATVTALNTDQTTSIVTTTGDAGNFVFAQLAPANYTVIVEAKGFKKGDSVRSAG